MGDRLLVPGAALPQTDLDEVIASIASWPPEITGPSESATGPTLRCQDSPGERPCDQHPTDQHPVDRATPDRATPDRATPDESAGLGNPEPDRAEPDPAAGARELLVRLAGCPLHCLTCRAPGMRSDSAGQDVSLAEVLTRLWSCHDPVTGVGGALTLTGGDPFAQPRFTVALLHRAHRAGFRTTVETPGYLGGLIPDSTLAQIDLVVLDLKSADPRVSRFLTGADAEPAVRLARRLAELARPTRIRFLVVPGINDGPEHIAPLARLIADLGPGTHLQLAGYAGGPTTNDRPDRPDRQHPLSRVPRATPAHLERARRLFESHGCPVLATGSDPTRTPSC